MIQITYCKKNGDIIKKTITTSTSSRVGEINGYGWKVVDIKYLYRNKYVSLSEYDRLLDKDWNRSKWIVQFKNTLRLIYHNLGYCIGLLVIFRILELSFIYSK